MEMVFHVHNVQPAGPNQACHVVSRGERSTINRPHRPYRISFICLTTIPLLSTIYYISNCVFELKTNKSYKLILFILPKQNGEEKKMGKKKKWNKRRSERNETVEQMHLVFILSARFTSGRVFPFAARQFYALIALNK